MKTRRKWDFNEIINNPWIGGILFMLALFFFFRGIFTLFVFSCIILLFYAANYIVEEYRLKETKYYYGVVATYLIVFLLVWGGVYHIIMNTEKIDQTFKSRTQTISTYFMPRSSKWKITIEPNMEWIFIESITNTWSK